MERLTDYSDDECTYIIGVGNKTCEEFVKRSRWIERAVRFDAIGKEDMGESCYRLEDIGRIVFLTREEAEKKLEEMKAND